MDVNEYRLSTFERHQQVGSGKRGRCSLLFPFFSETLVVHCVRGSAAPWWNTTSAFEGRRST